MSAVDLEQGLLDSPDMARIQSPAAVFSRALPLSARACFFTPWSDIVGEPF